MENKDVRIGMRVCGKNFIKEYSEWNNCLGRVIHIDNPFKDKLPILIEFDKKISNQGHDRCDFWFGANIPRDTNSNLNEHIIILDIYYMLKELKI